MGNGTMIGGALLKVASWDELMFSDDVGEQSCSSSFTLWLSTRRNPEPR